MNELTIISHKTNPLLEFLEQHDFLVDDLGENVYKITREDELPVFIHNENGDLYFEVDLGNISEIASQEIYFKLLDLNTEILPVSFGINNTNPDDPRLVIVESRETGHLDDNEILSVFDALELAVDKAAELLSQASSSS